MSTTEYRAGEVVNITISGARVNYTGEDGHVSIALPGDTDDKAWLTSLWLRTDLPAWRIARVVPAEGEPRPGEVWADQAGGTYFARLDMEDVPAPWVELLPSAGGPSLPWLMVHNGPSGPIERVWRPDPPVVDDAQADEPEPEQRRDSVPAQPEGEPPPADSVPTRVDHPEDERDDLAEFIADRAADLSPGARCTCDHRLANHAHRSGCRRCDPGACTAFTYAGAEVTPVGAHERGRP